MVFRSFKSNDSFKSSLESKVKSRIRNWNALESAFHILLRLKYFFRKSFDFAEAFQNWTHVPRWPSSLKFLPFVERDWLLSLLMKSGPNSLLGLVFSLNKFQHHDPDSKQFLYFGDGVVWVESLQASWPNGEKMQNSIEGFAVGEMLNMMMNNGNKVLSRIKIRCSGICATSRFIADTSECKIRLGCTNFTLTCDWNLLTH